MTYKSRLQLIILFKGITDFEILQPQHCWKWISLFKLLFSIQRSPSKVVSKMLDRSSICNFCYLNEIFQNIGQFWSTSRDNNSVGFVYVPFLAHYSDEYQRQSLSSNYVSLCFQFSSTFSSSIKIKDCSHLLTVLTFQMK